MPLTFGLNIGALKSQSLLNKSNAHIGKLTTQLSTGKRINSASDGPADLALITRLETDAKLANTAIRNANDGVSLLNTSDSSLVAIQSVLFRISELAQQAANGVINNNQRSIIEVEVLALASEITRISSTSEFNSIKLLSASNNINIQVGLNGGINSQINLKSVTGTLDSLNLAERGSNILKHTVLGDTKEEAMQNAMTLVAAAKEALNEVSNERGKLGASTNRLESAISTLTNDRENFAASAEKINDPDVAKSAAELMKAQILQSAQVAIMAQANQQPAQVLKLLG